MTAQEFCYWLQGYVELNESMDSLNQKQFKIVKDHLHLVFKHVTPTYGPNPLNPKPQTTIVNPFLLDLNRQISFC